MNLKKLLINILLVSYIAGNCTFATESMMQGVEGSVRPVKIKTDNDTKKEKTYKHKTVLKHFSPYLLTVTNNNSKPIILSSASELHFLLDKGEDVTSLSRRDIYRKTRKRDMGRYYWMALPGSVIGAAITGITFFIGAPLGAAIAVGMYLPTDKAVRNNVKIAQDLNVNKDLPIRFEPQKTYEIRILAPNDLNIKAVKITNASFDMKQMYNMTFPVASEEKL